MTFEEVRLVVSEIKYKNYKFFVDRYAPRDVVRIYISGIVPDSRSDTYPGPPIKISNMIEIMPSGHDQGSLVELIFGALVDGERHEAAEYFTYGQAKPYYPHRVNRPYSEWENTAQAERAYARSKRNYDNERQRAEFEKYGYLQTDYTDQVSIQTLQRPQDLRYAEGFLRDESGHNQRGKGRS